MKKIKNLFNNSKTLFVTATIILWIGAFALVGLDKINFATALTSLSTISAAVIALYQYYNREIEKKDFKMQKDKMFIENEILKVKNKRLSTANSKLRKENK